MKKPNTSETSATATVAVRAPIKPTLFDVDDHNATFSRFYPECEQLLLTPVGLEPLFNWLEDPSSVAIADFRAGAFRTILEFEKSNGFFDTAGRYGARIVVAFVLAPEEDSIALLKNLSGLLGDRVVWLVVRSTFKHGNWSLWENSKTRVDLAELDFTEMSAPTLKADAFSALGQYTLTATAAVDHRPISLANRSSLATWRNNYLSEIERAVLPLLNDEGKTMFLVTGDKGGVGKSSLARALTDSFHNPAKSYVTPLVVKAPAK